MNTSHVLPPPDLPMLGQRQREVIVLLARHMSTTQIAVAMSISVNTVRTQIRRALRRLGAETRAEAVETARDLGLV